MSWQKKINDSLSQRVGIRVVRNRPTTPGTQLSAGKVSSEARPPADPETDRLVKDPVFVLSTPRAGSTLLRVLLNSHSQLHAPHETHVRRFTVKATTEPAVQAMEAMGHNAADVEHLLWDRVLHRELVRSGKRYFVEKTPSNVFVWRRLATCWPDGRFIVLLRHPCSIVRSWHEGNPQERPMELALKHTRNYMEYLEHARSELDALTVRYEDLTADPALQTQRICDYLGIGWEPGMLQYGRKDHGEFVKGIGDWSEKIQSGEVQAGRPLPRPQDIPEELLPYAKAWGYPVEA